MHLFKGWAFSVFFIGQLAKTNLELTTSFSNIGLFTVLFKSAWKPDYSYTVTVIQSLLFATSQ